MTRSCADARTVRRRLGSVRDANAVRSESPDVRWRHRGVGRRRPRRSRVGGRRAPFGAARARPPGQGGGLRGARRSRRRWPRWPTGGARQGRGRGARSRSAADTSKRKRDSLARASSAPLDRQGYIGGKLDLDVATLAQLDSLPGVSLLMARRIVLDRMAHGPFVTRDGLRRVSGVGQFFLTRIDSLVTFSGTVRMPSPADTACAAVEKAADAGPAVTARRPAARRTAAPPRARSRRAGADSWWPDRAAAASRRRATSARARESPAE